MINLWLTSCGLGSFLLHLDFVYIYVDIIKGNGQQGNICEPLTLKSLVQSIVGYKLLLLMNGRHLTHYHF